VHYKYINLVVEVVIQYFANYKCTFKISEISCFYCICTSIYSLCFFLAYLRNWCWFNPA